MNDIVNIFSYCLSKCSKGITVHTFISYQNGIFGSNLINIQCGKSIHYVVSIICIPSCNGYSIFCSYSSFYDNICFTICIIIIFIIVFVFFRIETNFYSIISGCYISANKYPACLRCNTGSIEEKITGFIGFRSIRSYVTIYSDCRRKCTYSNTCSGYVSINCDIGFIYGGYTCCATIYASFDINC